VAAFESSEAARSLLKEKNLRASSEHATKSVVRQAQAGILIMGCVEMAEAAGLGAGPRVPRHQPTTSFDPSLRAGEGNVDRYGNVTVSPHGTAEQRAGALAHERGHSAVTPKVQNAAYEARLWLHEAGYDRSHLLRAAEEAFAETKGQITSQGVSLRRLRDGVTFPLRNGASYGLAHGRVLAEATAVGAAAGAGAKHILRSAREVIADAFASWKEARHDP
jgi:hypothetical protein